MRMDFLPAWIVVVACVAGCGATNTTTGTIPTPPPPPPSVSDTLYNSNMNSSADVISPIVGSGTGAVVQGGNFTGGGYEATEPGEVLTIPHESIGWDAAKGTIVFEYVPNYASADNVKRNIVLASEWDGPGFHFGKHFAPNNMALYYQFRGGDGVLRDVFILRSEYQAWNAGDTIEWRITWDVSRAPNVLRVWQNGCELIVDQSSIPSNITPGDANTNLWIGGGDSSIIHADGKVTELLVLSEPVVEASPDCP